MPISWALCMWRTVHYDWHGDAVMKMTGVELGHEIELEHEELHKSHFNAFRFYPVGWWRGMKTF